MNRRAEIRLGIHCFFFIGTLITSWAGASAQDISAERLAKILSGVEQLPDQAYWHRLGGGILPILEVLYEDQTRPTFVRLRAVTVTAYFHSPSAFNLLLKVAKSSKEQLLFLREAILGMAGMGEVAATDEVEPFLHHPNPQIRKAAAIALGTFENQASRVALKNRLGIETHRMVQMAIQHALAWKDSTILADREVRR